MKTFVNNFLVLLTIVFGPFMIAVMLIQLINSLATIIESMP